MAEFFISVRAYDLPWPHEGRGATVYVKEGTFFRSQGGLTEEWGKTWRPVDAESIEHARRIGYAQAGVAPPAWTYLPRPEDRHHG